MSLNNAIDFYKKLKNEYDTLITTFPFTLKIRG